jgi:porphobilinogen synthase
MPGVDRHTVRDIAPLARQLDKEGIRSVLVFGVARAKDAEGSDAWASDGLVPEAVRAIKRAAPGLVVVTDV